MTSNLSIKSLKKLFFNISPELKIRLILIGIVLTTLHAFVWSLAVIFWHNFPVFFSLIAVSYGLGLRHAVDADHIAAIDNTTRKLIQENKKPIAVGFFFSLGHSTVVLIFSLLASASAAYMNKHLSAIFGIGQLFGTLISSIFLLVIGFINLIYLINILKLYLRISKDKSSNINLMHEHFNQRGIIIRLYKFVLKTIDASWKMFFIGFLFGLSFDTSSEISLLSISVITGRNGIPLLISVLLPLAFAAGMLLVDTLDGILMLGAYGWANISPFKKLYYNMLITAISVIVALFIGSIEFFQIASLQLKSENWFFQIINKFRLENLGFIIIGLFLLIWLTSVLVFKIKKSKKRSEIKRYS